MNIHDLYEQRNNYYITPSQVAKGGLYLCIVLGLVAFAIGMATGNATRTWGSLIFNLFFFFSLGLGGVAFAGMQDVIGAKWGRAVMRVHEGFASFLPVAVVLFAILFACIHFNIGRAREVYVWINDPHMLDHFWGKKTWLQPGFMFARDLFALFVILGLSRWQLNLKLKRDLALVEGNKDKALELGLAAKAKLRHWSAPVLVCYAICFSLLAFDITMSLAPLWFSTLWGGWNFAVMMQTLMATLLVFMFALQSTPVGQLMKRTHFHDVGKLMHGFTIFFAYLTYAHVLTYWYGNVPEETEYFIHRLHQPWITFVIVAPLLCFVLPLFALIPKPAKWTKGITVPLSLIILGAQWMVALVIVMPETTDGAEWAFPWVELGVFFGILGLFLATWFRFAKKYPMVALADPLLVESLADDHH